MKYLPFVFSFLFISCNYCPDIEIQPHEGDCKLNYEVLMKTYEQPMNSSQLRMLIREKPPLVQGFEFLQDIDYSKYDVLNIDYSGHHESRSTKGEADFEVMINTRFRQINCYSYIKYDDCYGGVSSGLRGWGVFVCVKVPKLPNDYELNSYGN